MAFKLRKAHWKNRILLALALGLGSIVAGCASDGGSDPGDLGTGDALAPVLGSQDGASTASAEDDPEAVPGDDGDGVDKAANCNVVQWCNAPGSDGTVCQLAPGCCNQTGIDECIRETRTVCGSPVQPWVYYCR